MRIKAFNLTEADVAAYGLEAFMGKCTKHAIRVALVKDEAIGKEEPDESSFMSPPFRIILSPSEIADEDGVLAGKPYKKAVFTFNNAAVKNLVSDAYEALTRGEEISQTSISGTVNLGEVNMDIEMIIIAGAKITVRTNKQRIKVLIEQKGIGKFVLEGPQNSKLTGSVEDSAPSLE